MASPAVSVQFIACNYSQFDRRAVRSAFGKAGRLAARTAKKLGGGRSGSGITYTRRGVTWQASQPGQPPARYTGTLWRSIQGRASRRGYAFRVAAVAPHAVLTELGTRQMGARPLLPGVVTGLTGEITDLLRAAIGDGLTVVGGPPGKPPAQVEIN